MKRCFNFLVVAAIFIGVAMIVPSCAKDGKDGEPGKQGDKGEKGDKGDPGANAVISISDDGYWVINGVKTNVKAQGEKGEPGTSPTIEISDDGYWVINGEKTNVKAEGEQGKDGNNGNDGKNSYLVVFDANGGLPMFRIYGVLHGDKVIVPNDPEKGGYTFGGWYIDEELENAWNPETAITDNITLYAKWWRTMTMTTQKSGEVLIIMQGSGTATIDWDDGTTSETKTLSNVNTEFKHTYSSTSPRTINITGENITELVCSAIQLTSLAVSNNTALVLLDCNANQITSLDVSNNSALTHLNCGDNKISNLDVSDNTMLIQLRCGVNQLTSLDVSNNTMLTWVEAWGNQLESLDVTNNTALITLDCFGNKLLTTALNNLFGTLNSISGGKSIRIAGNPGADDCNRSIAEDKGWTFFH